MRNINTKNIRLTKDKKLDFEFERNIALRWITDVGLKYSKYDAVRSDGFYFIDNGKKRKKIYFCCTRDLGTLTNSKFWFGFPSTHISGNEDIAIILILVWENNIREYLVLNNNEVLRWRNYWYNKNKYFSITVNVNTGSYIMRGKDALKIDVTYLLNDILSIFD